MYKRPVKQSSSYLLTKTSIEEWVTKTDISNSVGQDQEKSIVQRKRNTIGEHLNCGFFRIAINKNVIVSGNFIFG